jgi:hypothetical protein
MNVQSLQERIAKVEGKREMLLKLQSDPTIGTLSLDVNQALIEMDDLKAEFEKTFPDGIAIDKP